MHQRITVNAFQRRCCSCNTLAGGSEQACSFHHQKWAEAFAAEFKADLELLWQRVRHKTTRPLLRTADPRTSLASLVEARTPIYALAEITVESQPYYTIDDMAGKVIEALESRPDILGAE